MKNKNDYVITKSNLTLTQSGMLALLLERQRGKMIELARRRAQCEHLRSALKGDPRSAPDSYSRRGRWSTIH